MRYYLLMKRMRLYLVLAGIFSFLTLSVKAADIISVNSADNSAISKNAGLQAAVLVTGTVTDEAGQNLMGVTVRVKGTNAGQTTDADGRFRISAPDANSTLVFSYVGYTTQEVPLNGRTEITVQLSKSTARNLNEVVVVGYGSQRRATVTGAISTVNAQTVTALPVASVDQALQGRVAGLNITNNGSPGTTPLVTIRGISSISFASDPLYVVDGFPLTTSLTQYDPKDVERVDVLKDASTAAIYGSRATNGVILVTTKKGSRNGRMSVNFDSYAGIQSPVKTLDLLNTQQYLQYANALGVAAGIPRFQPENFNAPIYAGAQQTYAQTNTDWQEEYFKRNTLLTGSNISLNGGNDISRFHSSAGYFKQDGIAQALSFERLNYRINSDHTISKVFTFGENLYTSVSHQRYDATGGNRTPLTNVIRMQPYMPVYDPTKLGGFQGPISSFDGADPVNPVETALIGYNKLNTFNVLGTAFLDVNFASWLRFRSTFGVNYINALTNNYTPIFNDGGTGSASTASINFRRQSYVVKLYSQQLTFDKTFDKHHVAATLVFETQGTDYHDQQESGNQTTNQIQTLGGAGNLNAVSNKYNNFLESYVARVNYDFAGKYLLGASIRRDGLSIWAPGHKYENFPAASIGWKIDQEEFLKESKSISELKIRASYGTTGINSNPLGYYPYLSPVQVNASLYPVNNTLPGSPNASFTNGLTNPDLVWEKTKQLNIGLDLGLLNNKFTVTAEFFDRKTDGLMINVPTPSSFGFLSQGTLANAGAMRNRGVELQLGYRESIGDFKYDVTGLVSVIRNKVLSLNSPNASIPSASDPDFGGGDAFTNTVAGRPIQYFYGWIADGLFQSQAQVDAANAAARAATGDPTTFYQSSATAPGDIRFRDISGPNGRPDGIIDNYDRTNIGSFLPKFTYSLNLTASYKNFDASVFFQGVQGNKILNAERIILEGMPRLFNAGVQVLNAWTPNNTNTDIPRAVNGDPNRNARLSTRWIEDGSYLRLKNIIIGYTLPAASLNSLTKSTIKRLRVFVASTNLLTFTGYKGFDPEIGSKNGTLTNGVDFGQYPSARSFQFGIQAGF